jgi:phage FluMu protein Com
MAKADLVEFRCPNDKRLLFKVSALEGVEVEVRCPRCREVVKAELRTEETTD